MSQMLQLPAAIINWKKMQTVHTLDLISVERNQFRNIPSLATESRDGEIGSDCLLSCHWTQLKRAWLHLFTLPSAINHESPVLTLTDRKQNWETQSYGLRKRQMTGKAIKKNKMLKYSGKLCMFSITILMDLVKFLLSNL